ncbi:hypothetical protein B0H13DRAFT_1853988 [Mycena leptocephala]|nr:hypothetical protein B0H13DRAFT_1853988 [Mycena leptocephala]
MFRRTDECGSIPKYSLRVLVLSLDVLGWFCCGQRTFPHLRPHRTTFRVVTERPPIKLNQEVGEGGIPAEDRAGRMTELNDQTSVFGAPRKPSERALTNRPPHSVRLNAPTAVGEVNTHRIAPSIMAFNFPYSTYVVLARILVIVLALIFG